MTGSTGAQGAAPSSPAGGDAVESRWAGKEVRGSQDAGDSWRAREAAHAAALAGLPGMGPATLVRILTGASPSQAWQAVRRGVLTPPGRQGGDRWAAAAARVEPEAWWESQRRRGVEVTWWGDESYPPVLRGDPSPPGVLFWAGSLHALDRARVAVVGTRSATPEGMAVAYQLGRDLAAAGVCVVSGLAIGIDGAAHSGALAAAAEGGAAAPVGVAASGVDVPYPRRHALLWKRVAACGAILSENLPGRPAQAWRFPSRNRVIAGLSQMVVVVESHASGGSLITADAAIERGVEVRAVPGPVRSPASAGSNQLLYDGPGPVRDARDVLDGLGLLTVAPASGRDTRRAASARGSPLGAGRALVAPPVDPDEAEVIEAMGWRPATLGQVAERCGRPPVRVAAMLERLAQAGLVAESGGWWSRRVGGGR
ncbi:MAG TPA: DNA-processing protein DprA [Acidimicrobiales bacterium]|nr:DNA-processing protein DprA [Acidimicrobiales bacterium]